MRRRPRSLPVHRNALLCIITRECRFSKVHGARDARPQATSGPVHGSSESLSRSGGTRSASSSPIIASSARHSSLPRLSTPLLALRRFSSSHDVLLCLRRSLHSGAGCDLWNRQSACGGHARHAVCLLSRSVVAEALTVRHRHQPTVIAAGRRKANLDELTKKHERMESLQIDQSASFDELKSWVKATLEQFPNLDSVFFVAGVQYRIDLSTGDEIDWQAFQVRFTSLRDWRDEG